MNKEIINRAIEETTKIFPFDGYMNHSYDAYKNISNIIYDLLNPGSKILDIGSGPADKPAILQKLGFECIAYDDLNDDWHKVDNNKEKILKFSSEAGVKYVIADENDPHFNLESFDMLMFNGVLEHLHSSPRTMLNKFIKYLKPNGYLFITVPNAVNIRKRIAVLFGKTNLPDYQSFYYHPGDWRGHIREYVENDLILLTKNLGLTIKLLRGCDHMISTRLKKVNKILYLILTGLDRSLKDSWVMIAQKPDNWLPQKEIDYLEYLEYLNKKSLTGYSIKQ